MQRLDDQTTTQYVNLLVYGKTGTGKTSLGVSAPKPLILLSERQGLLHVRQAATRLGVPVPPVLAMESLEDYRLVLRALREAKPGQPFRVLAGPGDVALELPEPPESLVLDSVTDAARIVVEEIRKQSPQQIGKDGLPVDSQRFWSVLSDRVQNLILAFRDAPCHTIFLALADDREAGEGEQKSRTVTPAMPMRKLPDMIAAAVNAVGYSYRAEKRDDQGAVKTAFGVLFAGPEHLMLKACAPLRDRERPNITAWIQAIQAGVGLGGEAPPRSLESLVEGAAETVETTTPPETQPAAEPAAEPQQKRATRKTTKETTSA